MKKLKIAIIGGGSGYTPELVKEFIERYPKMPISELWLVDVEAGEDKLSIITELSKRIVKKQKSEIVVHQTTNRKEALKDADFVLTQFRAGQMEARVLDENIPLKYGSIGQETNGPGEMLYAFRMIPVMLDIVKEMEEYCPEAWLINFANPAGMLVEAVLNYTNWTKIISICNGPLNMENAIAKALGVERERIFVEFVGLNHLFFTKSIYLDGKEVTPKVLSILNEGAHRIDNPGVGNWDSKFLQSLGMIPMSYLQYYWKTKEVVAEEQEAASTAGSRAIVAKKQEQSLFEIYQDPKLDYVPKELAMRGGAGYSNCACNLIYSIYSDKRDVQTVNTANCGAILDLEMDDVVEVNCLITNKGPIPLVTGKLPIAIRGIIQEVKSFEKIAVKAAVTGDYEAALLALTINPLVYSDVDAKKMLDEMLVANEEHLPQFDISNIKK